MGGDGIAYFAPPFCGVAGFVGAGDNKPVGEVFEKPYRYPVGAEFGFSVLGRDRDNEPATALEDAGGDATGDVLLEGAQGEGTIAEVFGEGLGGGSVE